MKLFFATLLVAFAAVASFAQSPPTLRIVTEAPNLPSELFYGDIKVKPLRLRPGTNVPITINDADFYVTQQYVDFLSRFPDQSGFNFWLTKVNSVSQPGEDMRDDNQALGRVQRAEMVRAFVESIEYRGRF